MYTVKYRKMSCILPSIEKYTYDAPQYSKLAPGLSLLILMYRKNTECTKAVHGMRLTTMDQLAIIWVGSRSSTAYM